MNPLARLDRWRRWSVTALGALLFGVIICTIAIIHPDLTTLDLLQKPLPVLLALGLTGYGGWLARSALPTERITRIALWCLAGTVVIGSFAMWELSLDLAEGNSFAETVQVLLRGATEGALVGGLAGYYDARHREQHQETKRRKRQLNTLHQATRDMMAAATRQEVADVAREAGDDILDVPVNIHLYDEDADGLVPVAVSETTRAVLGDPPTIQTDEGIAWRVYESGDPEIYADVRTAPGVLNPETPIRSEYCLPLGEHGVLLAAATTVDAFDEADISLLKILAATVETAFDRAHREQELRRRKRELQRQNDRLDEFASVVSHDLRNPLNVASGRLDLAREMGDDEHFEEIADALNRMEKIIEDVLTLAREGDAVGDTESVGLDTIAYRAWNNVDTGSASFQCDTDREIDVDASRVGQLFENLFQNAVEHGGEEVTVRIGWLADHAGFYVEDTGPGISREKRASVFESGYTTESGGTGFGLAIVKEIAEAHGWEIDVTEGADGGARFEVTTEQGGS